MENRNCERLMETQNLLNEKVKEALDTAKKFVDIEDVDAEDFAAITAMINITRNALAENLYLCRVLCDISEKQDAILDRLKKLEAKG